MDFIKKNGKGLLFCLALAVPSAVLGKLFPVVGGPVFAILIGMILALVIKKRDSLECGIKYTLSDEVRPPQAYIAGCPDGYTLSGVNPPA